MTEYGYYTNSGYLGLIEDGTMILFPTEQEYKEYLKEVTE